MRDEFKNNNWDRRFLPHYNAVNKYQMVTYRLADSLPLNLLKLPRVPHSDAGINSRGSLKLPGAPHSDAGLEAKRRKEIESILDLGYGCCLLSKPDVAEKAVKAWKFFDGERYDLISYVVMPNHVHVLIKTKSHSLGKIVWSWKRHVTKYVFENDRYRKLFEENMKLRSNVNVESRAPESKKRFILPASECGAPGNTLPASECGAPGNTLPASECGAPGNTLPASECGAPGNTLPASECRAREQSPSRNSLWQREYWDRFIRDERHFNQAIEYIHQNPVKAQLVSSSEEWMWSSASLIS